MALRYAKTGRSDLAMGGRYIGGLDRGGIRFALALRIFLNSFQGDRIR
jgi:hypothetical protein